MLLVPQDQIWLHEFLQQVYLFGQHYNLQELLLRNFTVSPEGMWQFVFIPGFAPVSFTAELYGILSVC